MREIEEFNFFLFFVVVVGNPIKTIMIMLHKLGTTARLTYD